MFKNLYSTIIAVGLFLPQLASAETWNVDSSHSQVSFEVDHMMISTVKGDFGSFSGELNTDSKGKLTSMSGEVSIISVDTDNKKRDTHLQGDDFFNAELFPNITFKSSKMKGSHEKGYTVDGELTIRDVTKSVTLKLSPIKGPVVDGWGNTKIGTTATTTIDRQEFGVSWNSTLDAGGLVVSDDVRITLNLELAKSAK
jgi:polyisoprenoid-binding protein YceI